MLIHYRSKKWLKEKMVNQYQDYSQWSGLEIFRQDNVVTIRSYTGNTLGYYNLVNNVLDVEDEYFSTFPCNRNWDDPEKRIRDFIDLVWFYTTPAYQSNNPFRNSVTGLVPDKTVQVMIDRNLDENFNQITSKLNAKWSRHCRGDSRVGGISTIMFSGEGYSFLGDSISRLVHMYEYDLPPYDYIMENLGFRFHYESNSWWTNSEFNSGGVPKEWIAMKPVTCSCGRQVAKKDLIKNKCKSCWGLSENQLMIHSYSQRAPNLLGFKGDKKKGNTSQAYSNFVEKYYNKVLPNLPVQVDSVLYLGVEMEYESRDTGISKYEIAIHLKDHAIMKTDGSLNNGIEIVTCPATYEEQVKALKPFFDDFPESLSAQSTCGIHVHVSRAALSATTQGRLLAFLHNESNRDALKDIAGRYSSRYAAQESGINVSSILRGSGNRYQIINTQNNSTLEFRMFKGTEDWNTILQYLQFVCALVEYCKPCATAHSFSEHKKFDNFVAWLKNYRRDYPELFSRYYKRKEKNLNRAEEALTIST